MAALTRAEACSRARLLNVRSYAVHLDLTRGSELFGATTVIRFGCAEPGAATFVDLKAASLGGAVLNGRALDPATLTGDRLALPELAADNELRIEAEMRYSRTGEGLHRFVDPVDDEVYVYTQCWPDETARVFGCFDQPDLKAGFEISVTAPEHWTVLSNGAGTRRAGGRWEFTPTAPISTYLAVIAGGDLHSVRTEHDGIPLGLYCRRSLSPYLDAEAGEILDVTRRSFDRYHELFDERYPFGTYDQAFVPEFNGGAMENAGCVLFRDEFLFRSAVTDTEREFRAIAIAHEMAHMWFGNLVTMRWWDDLWLSESFAEYMGTQVITEVSRFTTAWTGFTVKRKAWGYDTDQRRSTHPVAAQGIDDTAAALANFDGISYAKGASALRQLVAWVGEEAFLAGLGDYFARHRFDSADLSDLLAALGRASGRDVHGWAKRWLRTSGVDTLRVETTVSDGVMTSAEVVHTGTPGTPAAPGADGDPGGPRPHRIHIGLYDLVGGTRLVRRERHEADLAADPAGPGGPVRTPLPRLAGVPRPDLLLPNDGDLSYAKIRLDAHSWRTVTRALSTIEDPRARALLWHITRDLVRDAELSPADYLTLTTTHLPAEPVVAIVQAVLTFCRREIAERLLPPELRPSALAVLTDVCRKILYHSTGDDPGIRLTAVRGLIQCAAAPNDLAGLRQWLRAGRVPGGPDLDPELRWKTLLRLSGQGAAGEADIAAELARDPSATGKAGAARCRAAVPDRAAKEQAWQRLFTDGALSNHLLMATAEGFWQSARSEPLAGFAERYFAEIPAAGRRGPMVARVLGHTLFPLHDTTPEIVRATEGCLNRDDLTAPLRRILADELDDLRRAVEVRTRF